MKEAPAYLLWTALSKTLSDAQSLWVNVLSVQAQFKVLDETGAGPDDVIEDNVALWIHNRCRPAYLLNLMRAKRELNRALEAARLASQSLNNSFSAQLPFAIRGRVGRQVTETEQLISQLDDLERQYEIPTQPRKIREHALAELSVGLDDVLGQLTALVAEFEGQDLSQPLRGVLVEQQAQLAISAREILTLRGQVDHRLSVPFNPEVARIESVQSALSELKTSARIECQSLGMKFYNRAGEIK